MTWTPPPRFQVAVTAPDIAWGIRVQDTCSPSENILVHALTRSPPPGPVDEPLDFHVSFKFAHRPNLFLHVTNPFEEDLRSHVFAVDETTGTRINENHWFLAMLPGRAHSGELLPHIPPDITSPATRILRDIRPERMLNYLHPAKFSFTHAPHVLP